MDDWLLVRKYAAGDPGAMESLIRRHIDIVYSTACRAAGSGDADDVTQAVFLLLSRRAAGMAERGTVAGWLYRTTRLCAANLRKMEGRRRRRHKEAGMRAASRERQSDRAAEWMELLDEGLQRLREEERAAVLLRHADGRSFDECAAILGMTAEAARKRADRGLLKLRQFFAARGMTMPAAGLGAMVLTAPPETLSAVIAAVHGAPVAASAAALAKGTVLHTGVSKLTAVALCASIMAAAFGLSLFIFRGSPAGTVPAGIAATIPVAATRTAPSETTLPRVQLVAANPGHPTEDEVRTFLKARLERLNNLQVEYTVKTEYPRPPAGWPQSIEPTLTAMWPEMVVLAEAELLGRDPLPYVAYPLFPNGTVEMRKSFRLWRNQARYESEIVKLDRAVPLPDWARTYHHTIEMAGPERLDQLFYFEGDAPAFAISSRPLAPRIANAGLLDPDVELALGLSGSIGGYKAAGHWPAYQDRMTRTFRADDIENAGLRFPDEDHVVVVHLTPASAQASTSPAAGRSFTESDWKEAQFLTQDEWTLDRKLGYAPVKLRHPYGRPDRRFEMEMSDFHEVGGIMVPRKATTRHFLATPDGSTDHLWRTDTLAIQNLAVQDSANDAAAFVMQWPEAARNHLEGMGQNPAFVGLHDPAVLNLESAVASEPMVIGAEVFSPTWLRARGDPRTLKEPMNTSADPSRPRGFDSPWWQARHKSFRDQAAMGGVDVLFLGDGLAEAWGLEKDLWTRDFAPLHAANFGLRADGVENVWWRVMHGELQGLSPKVIVVLAGSVNAGTVETAGTLGRPTSPGRKFDWPYMRYDASYSRVGVRRLVAPPEVIAAAIEALVREVQEQSPASKILLLGIPPQGTKPSMETVATIRSRITAINDQLRKLDDGGKVRFADLASRTTEPDGTLNPDDFLDGYIPKTKVYARWTEVVAPLVKEMMK